MNFPILKRSFLILLAAAGCSQAATVIFDNQFNGTWSGVNNGTPFSGVATFTPTVVSATFTNNGDALGTTWTVDTLTPQPWNIGGVIFTGGGNTTGAMSTSFSSVLGATYQVSWDVDLVGDPTTTNLIASAGGQTQVLNSTDPDGTFTFIGTGGTMTLSIGVNTVGANGGSDVQVDYVRLEQIPEPSVALLGGLSALALLRRRRA